MLIRTGDTVEVIAGDDKRQAEPRDPGATATTARRSSRTWPACTSTSAAARSIRKAAG